ncbi:hypothetical protein F0266_15215 [Vibrio coralliilyticus]|uniref:hypothetical protein n=1 Tax=Vibrio coralliilyticus TaxID=190893 RepID=UPI00148B9E45|nr:hypothetical protein [Vibrio coralliilyticus]NOH54287.1 hypothetical protein [Vibrio coralliilyticus]
MLFLSFSLVNFSVCAENIIKSFNISTYIDKGKIYPYTLEIIPDESNFLLEYDEATKTFLDHNVQLDVVSDIPNSESSMGFGYNLNLLENHSICRRSSDDTVSQEGFINLLIDGNPFDQTQPANALLLSPSKETGNLTGQTELTLKSQLIKETMLSCSGAISIEAELSL